MLEGQGCSGMKASVILFNLSLEIRKARFKERQILGSDLLGLGGRVGTRNRVHWAPHSKSFLLHPLMVIRFFKYRKYILATIVLYPLAFFKYFIF